MTSKDKMVDKRAALVDLMKNYVNEQGSIDITKFRLENPTEYALLPHYFGGVNSAIDQCGWIKVVKTKGRQGSRATLRNQLAYDMIKDLRKKNTLEVIGNKYGVSRAAINQLFKALESEVQVEPAE